MICVMSPSQLDIYTDGACLGNHSVATRKCATGWGVVVVKSSGSDEVVLSEMFGTVVLDSSSMYYMGAEVGSNNTAELTAIGEALLWLIENWQGRHASGRIDTVVIRYDSEYAAQSIMGVFNGKKNRKIIDTIRAYYARVRSIGSSIGCSVSFVHVKGHSGDRWNDRADRLATSAASTQSTCTTGRYGLPAGSSAILTTRENSEEAGSERRSTSDCMSVVDKKRSENAQRVVSCQSPLGYVTY